MNPPETWKLVLNRIARSTIAATAALIIKRSACWRVLPRKIPQSNLKFGLAGVAVLFCCTACNNLSYYAQAANGHLNIMAKRESIDTLLSGDSLSEKRRSQLQQAQQIQEFASSTLYLPDNGSYQSYVELENPYVVWNAVVAPRFSLKPEQWCFPIAGCVSYRGYYAKTDAEEFARSYNSGDYDIYVGGSRAYSTLGWFRDPLTSAMLSTGDILLAEVIFHELAHQKLYIKNDTSFNEAFASAVGEAGVLIWLKEKQPESVSRYNAYLTRKNAFNQLLAATAGELRELYSSNLDTVKMQLEKQRIMEKLSENYARLKRQWQGYSGYDGWFEKPVNNARLALIAVYRDLIPEFNRWIEACNQDLRSFYQTIAPFAELNKAARLKKLKGPASCSV